MARRQQGMVVVCLGQPVYRRTPGAMAMVATPGMKKGWLNTALPMRVEPVSSISTAASRVRVGRQHTAHGGEGGDGRQRADTQCQGGRHQALVVGLAKKAWRKNSTTASSQLYWLSRSPANAWISTMLPFTKTLPSQATPSTQIQADIPEGRHVGDLGRVQFAEQYHQGGGGEHDAHDGAIAGIGGLLMRPTLPEMAVA